MATTQAHSNGDPLEKDFSNHSSGKTYHLGDPTMDSEVALNRIRTAGSISISPELFEKIYLSPQNVVKGDLRKTFGNPTPVGAYFFFGGLLMMVGGILEFVLGNTFPFVVFVSFGAFWLTFASTLQPFYHAYGSYAPAGSTSEAAGLSTVGFNASFAFFMLFMSLLCFIYLICALRTNMCFVVIFLTLVVAFSLLAGTYWQTANSIANSDPSAAALAHRLQVAAGAVAFVTCAAGWWIFFAIMLAALDFPFQVPVGDLSTLIKGASEKKKAEEHMA
ncbi:hypothetical protein B7463_g5960, partial [Scytalidium lignicola]